MHKHSTPAAPETPPDQQDHCLICQKVIPPGADFCSDECAEKARQEMEIEILGAETPRKEEA